MTPKMRFKPSASSASRPASSSPLMSASTKKMSSWQSIYSPPLSSRNFARRDIRDDSSHPHVRLADIVAGGKLGGGAGGLDAADLEQIGPIDDLQHLAHVLLDDQHGVAFGADAAHEVEHLDYDDG